MDRRKFIIDTSKTISLLSVFGTTNIGLSALKETKEKLVILHTNDTHSRLDPFENGQYKGMGGVSNRKRIIDNIRETEKNVLLLDAGDIFQGTPYFNVYSGELEIKAMSMLGYDVATMGNHDFDLGIDNFDKQIKHANFPFVVSNYNFEDTILSTKMFDYKIIKKNNIKIGIVGAGIKLEGLVLKNNYKEIVYSDPIEKVSNLAARLKNDYKCNLVICLSHLGYKYENEKTMSDVILAKNSSDIDIIIGGHTHTFLDKPKLFLNKVGKSVIVNQVGFGGINLGKIEVYFDKNSTFLEGKKSFVINCQ